MGVGVGVDFVEMEPVRRSSSKFEQRTLAVEGAGLLRAFET